MSFGKLIFFLLQQLSWKWFFWLSRVVFAFVDWKHEIISERKRTEKPDVKMWIWAIKWTSSTCLKDSILLLNNAFLLYVKLLHRRFWPGIENFIIRLIDVVLIHKRRHYGYAIFYHVRFAMGLCNNHQSNTERPVFIWFMRKIKRLLDKSCTPGS